MGWLTIDLGGPGVEKILVNINGNDGLLTRDEWAGLFDILQQGDNIEIGGVRFIRKKGGEKVKK